MGASANEANRALAWDACLNVRDLGGLTTGDGRRVRRGALVRSDQLCRLKDAGREALLAHNGSMIAEIASIVVGSVFPITKAQARPKTTAK